MKLILVGVYGLIISIAALIISYIRNKPNHLHDQSGDFMSDFATYKQKQLAALSWRMKYETYITVAIVCAIVLALVGYFVQGIPLALLMGAAGAIIPEMVVRTKASAQKQKFEERFASSLRQLAAGLRSGMSLFQAVEDVCHSPFVHDDLRAEFRLISADLKLGMSTQDAFRRFAERVDCEDARDVAIAIDMQARVGGREAAVVEGIAKNINDRIMLRKEVNTLFAGSKVTMNVLDVAPFVILAFLAVAAPSFLTPYFESTTMTLVLIAIVAFMVVGSFVTRYMVKKMRKDSGV